MPNKQAKPKKTAANRAAKKQAPDSPAGLTRFQTFEVRRIHRRDIKNFAHNPRTITEDARKTLQRNLDVDKGGVGLLAPPTWNEVTGNCTGGHRRLAALDALEGSDNYLLDVAVVHLSQTAEIQANILLNNANAQGDWDADILAELLKSTPDLDLSATGFTVADIQLNFDDDELASLFTPNETTAALVGDIAALKADAAEQKRATRSPKSGDRDVDGDEGEAYTPGEHKRIETEQAEPDSATAAKAFRKRGKDQFNASDDTEVVAHVICKNRAERERLVERLGYPPDERYVDASRVWSRLKDPS